MKRGVIHLNRPLIGTVRRRKGFLASSCRKTTAHGSRRTKHVGKRQLMAENNVLGLGKKWGAAECSLLFYLHCYKSIINFYIILFGE